MPHKILGTADMGALVYLVTLKSSSIEWIFQSVNLKGSHRSHLWILKKTFISYTLISLNYFLLLASFFAHSFSPPFCPRLLLFEASEFLRNRFGPVVVQAHGVDHYVIAGDAPTPGRQSFWVCESARDTGCKWIELLFWKKLSEGRKDTSRIQAPMHLLSCLLSQHFRSSMCSVFWWLTALTKTLAVYKKPRCSSKYETSKKLMVSISKHLCFGSTAKLLSVIFKNLAPFSAFPIRVATHCPGLGWALPLAGWALTEPISAKPRPRKPLRYKGTSKLRGKTEEIMTHFFFEELYIKLSCSGFKLFTSGILEMQLKNSNGSSTLDCTSPLHCDWFVITSLLFHRHSAANIKFYKWKSGM